MTSEALPPRGVGRLESLAGRYGLGDGAVLALSCLLQSLVHEPLAPTAVRDPERVIDDHLADSLVALELPEVRRARKVVDIGTGAGLPGIPLAIALPEASFMLLDSSARKCAFVASVVASCRIENASVVHARAESPAAGLGSFDLATARAVAPLPVLLEYAAPLLRVGGVVVAWRGRRDAEAEGSADRASEDLGLSCAHVQHVSPFAGAEHRHLHLWSKVRETPERYPRRPGMALKRPLGGRPSSSDRTRR